MPYIPPEVLQEIKKVDLKTYLKEYEPRELVHFSGDVYTTRTTIASKSRMENGLGREPVLEAGQRWIISSRSED